MTRRGFLLASAAVLATSMGLRASVSEWMEWSESVLGVPLDPQVGALLQPPRPWTEEQTLRLWYGPEAWRCVPGAVTPYDCPTPPPRWEAPP